MRSRDLDAGIPEGVGTLDIRVHRKNMEVSPELLEAAERKLTRLEPFLDRSGWVELGFVEEQNPRIAEKYHCEIVAHVKGKRLKVEGSAGEPFAALDVAAQKVDKQVRRLKDKRVRKRHRGNGDVSGEVPLVPEPETEPEVEAAPDRAEPVIVEVGQAEAKPMTPVEAALQIEVSGQEFMLFQNAESGRAAVIYRRNGREYGLIEAPG